MSCLRTWTQRNAGPSWNRPSNKARRTAAGRCRLCSTRARKPSRSRSSWRRSPTSGIQGESTEPAGYPELENKAESEASKAAEPHYTAAQLAKGKEVFTTAGCGGCHTLAAAEASGTIGPNLDTLQPGEFAVYHQVYTGGGLMPKFGVEGILKPAEIEAVAQYVSSVAGTK